MTLFPQRADNACRGHPLALWCFGLVVLVKLGISLGSIFNGYGAATSADGIPLDTFPPGAAQTVLALFALLGLANLIICLVCIVALVHYRALVPLMFALLLLYQASRRIILYFLPVPRTGAPPVSAINLSLLAVMIVGLMLSLWNQGNRRPRGLIKP